MEDGIYLVAYEDGRSGVFFVHNDTAYEGWNHAQHYGISNRVMEGATEKRRLGPLPERTTFKDGAVYEIVDIWGRTTFKRWDGQCFYGAINLGGVPYSTLSAEDVAKATLVN